MNPNESANNFIAALQLTESSSAKLGSEVLKKLAKLHLADLAPQENNSAKRFLPAKAADAAFRDAEQIPHTRTSS